MAFLASEVPRWKAENDCYSCHNNGDAARALIAAAALGFSAGGAMDDTLDWLRRPLNWDRNKTEGGIDDKPLARIQFAGALRLAVAGGHASRAALGEAAEVVAADQNADGSWQLDTSQSIGSPATYGSTLATAMARRTLAASELEHLKPALARADDWLRSAKVESVVDAAAVLLGLEHAGDARARAQRERALATLRAGQGADGGWGPYVTVGPQVFDTALAILALDEIAGYVELAEPVFSASDYAPSRLARPRVPDLATERERQLAGDDTTRQPGELRAADLDHRLGAAGTAGHALRYSGFPGCRRCGVELRKTQNLGLVHSASCIWNLGALGISYRAVTVNAIVVRSGSGVRSARSKLSTSNARPMRLPARSSSMASAVS